MIRSRSSPVPPKASPISLTVVRRASWSTDSTVVEMSPSSFWVGMGVRVSSIAISDSSFRKGFTSDCGCSSTYCSPTAERLPTTASASAGMSSNSLSMSRWTSTPASVSTSLSTWPTRTPR